VPYDRFKRVYGGIDYGATSGIAHRTAAYLTGVLPDGRRLTFWEYSKLGPAAEDFFAQIAEVTKRFRVVAWYADSSQNRANELLRAEGIPIFDAPRYRGARKDGINLISRWLKPSESRPPVIFVHEDCQRLISAIQSYELDPETGEPKDRQPDDEIDAWRYCCMLIDEREMLATGMVAPIPVVPKRTPHPPIGSLAMQKLRERRREKIQEYLRQLET
jgi:hypothetical protein